MAVLSAAALVLSTAGAAADPTFDDVDHENSPHGEAISELAQRRILLGKGDGTFDPGGTLTRAQLASVVARAAGLAPSGDRPFDDVDGGPHAGNIAAAAEAGFVQGYPDGTFRPGQAITRDQIAALLARWLDVPPVREDAFSDLGTTIHAEAINGLAAIGVARGSTDGTFRPRASLRRDQAASFVFRAVQWRDEHRQEPHPWDEVGEDVLDTERPDGPIDGVAFHGTISVAGTSAVNPVRYEEGEALVTTGRFGMRIYDIRDRYEPKLIGTLDKAELALPGDDPSNNYHTAESLNIDKERKLAFLSRDPRAFSNQQETGISGFYIIDIADPTDPQLLRFHEVGAGHTSTCVNGCDFIWSGGPSRAATDPVDWIARPILVTDVRDPENPRTYDEPVDTGRYRGITDYAHDVQVDQQGVAWVSGRGGVRGYWTEGIHFDPTEDRYRTATAFDPVPFAGGEVGEYNEPADPRRLLGAIHNSERPVDGEFGDSAWTDSERPRRPGASDGAAPGGDHAPGELLYVTDENFSAPCSESGKFYIVSLEGADQGQAWRTADEYLAGAEPFALTEVSRWSVFDQEGTGGSTDVACSAHYFNMQDGVVAGGWYSQGFRFLDVTDPTDPNQIAYFRPEGGSGWSTHWIGEVIYANDSVHGIHILTLDADAAQRVETRSEVLAPQMTSAELGAARRSAARFTADPVFGWSCALPIDAA